MYNCRYSLPLTSFIRSFDTSKSFMVINEEYTIKDNSIKFNLCNVDNYITQIIIHNINEEYIPYHKNEKMIVGNERIDYIEECLNRYSSCNILVLFSMPNNITLINKYDYNEYYGPYIRNIRSKKIMVIFDILSLEEIEDCVKNNRCNIFFLINKDIFDSLKFNISITAINFEKLSSYTKTFPDEVQNKINNLTSNDVIFYVHKI